MEKVSAIILEKLGDMREATEKRSKQIRGRLNRWSFHKLQSILEYKAKLAGLSVVYVEARGTSSLYPICGEKLSPNGYRELICSKCGFQGDGDFVAAKNFPFLLSIGAIQHQIHGFSSRLGNLPLALSQDLIL